MPLISMGREGERWRVAVVRDGVELGAVSVPDSLLGATLRAIRAGVLRLEVGGLGWQKASNSSAGGERLSEPELFTGIDRETGDALDPAHRGLW